jgi:hypothetical protein
MRRWLSRTGITLICCGTIGCAGGADVTPSLLDTAKARWRDAGIPDYDLEWVSSGLNSAHYRVNVRENTVRRIDSIQGDGHAVELHPGEPRFYGVDGLFLTIADELAQKKTQRPFGQPPGTKVVMRFQFDPKLGYPLWYRRDVMGTMLSARIDVMKLTPLPSRYSK